MSDIEWRPVVGYESTYEVSNTGVVRSLDRRDGRGAWIRGRVLKTCPNFGGYPHVKLALNGTARGAAVHVLVAAAFLGPRPDGLQVHHRDGDRTNPNIDNLEYGTTAKNALDSVRHGTHANAAKTHCPKGHEYTPENTVRWPHRRCRACERARDAARAGRQKLRGRARAA